MKKKYLMALPLASALFVGCNSKQTAESEEVVSKRYIHKYGYDVSKEDFETTGYPGQTITTLRNGVTVTASYNDGILEGETTHTFPHSQTVEARLFYERGNLVKKISYDLRGIPQKEERFFSPSHIKTTKWFPAGTPMSVEEHLKDELLEAEYYNSANEVEYRVSRGSGVRIIRDTHGHLAMKEQIEGGYPILRETFHPHGVPHTITPLLNGEIHGEKKVFALSGEPISIEHYRHNYLDGLATYFQNGSRYLEITYKEGVKHGLERHFIDGEMMIEETEWHDGQRHGPSIVFFDGMSRRRYYYNDQLVSKERYNELCDIEENMITMNERTPGRA